MSQIIVLLILGFIIYSFVKAAKQSQQSLRTRRRRSRRPPPLPTRIATHRPEPRVDTTAWSEFARGMDLLIRHDGGPVVEGTRGGVRIVIDIEREPRTRTRIRVPLASPAPAYVRVEPSPGPGGEEEVELGIPEIDREYSVSCRWPSFARRVLQGDAAEWLLGLGDVEVTVSGNSVTARLPGAEHDLYRLRGLLELALAIVGNLAE